MSKKNIINNREIYSVYNRIPFSLLNQEDVPIYNLLAEMQEIYGYYKVYEEGSKFITEGTAGDYIASTLKYKLSYLLINKEARFLFAEKPDIFIVQNADSKKTTEQVKEMLEVYQEIINNVFDKNGFEDKLLKASKDCFIGKRVGCLINFNDENGITIKFYNALSFLYEFDTVDNNKLIKFVAYSVIKDRKNLSDKRIFRKKYTVEKDKGVYLEEQIFDGAANLISNVTPKRKIELDEIPAVVITNEGLSDDYLGESDLNQIDEFESYYSKLANGDIDSERKGMNPIKYTVNMDSTSTNNLSTSPGSYWDLMKDQNIEGSESVGVLETSMNYSNALDTTLKRIRTTAYEMLEIPDVTLENMSGVITSGKALEAVYWGLMVRCKEKMKVWNPAIRRIVDIIIKGSLTYTNVIHFYTDDIPVPVDYTVDVSANFPLPKDEETQKAMDLSEVTNQTMSRKSYMKKWRELTDEQVEDELKQIAYEKQIFDEANFIPENNYKDISEAQNGGMVDEITIDEENLNTEEKIYENENLDLQSDVVNNE